MYVRGHTHSAEALQVKTANMAGNLTKLRNTPRRLAKYTSGHVNKGVSREDYLRVEDLL